MKKPGKRARFKIQRKLGVELPGLGKAGALERRPYPPGENGNKRRKYSDYALRLEEKQKLRFHYELKEEQLRRFIRKSKQGQGTNWVNKLIGLLETRLDNIVFRMGMAPSIRSARQLVSHGHVRIDGEKVNISSYIVPQGAKVTLAEKAKENQIFLRGQQSPRLEVPEYMRTEEENGLPVAVIQATPGKDHIPFNFDAGLFTEYYAARKV